MRGGTGRDASPTGRVGLRTFSQPRGSAVPGSAAARERPQEREGRRQAFFNPKHPDMSLYKKAQGSEKGLFPMKISHLETSRQSCRNFGKNLTDQEGPQADPDNPTREDGTWDLLIDEVAKPSSCLHPHNWIMLDPYSWKSAEKEDF